MAAAPAWRRRAGGGTKAAAPAKPAPPDANIDRQAPAWGGNRGNAAPQENSRSPPPTFPRSVTTKSSNSPAIGGMLGRLRRDFWRAERRSTVKSRRTFWHWDRSTMIDKRKAAEAIEAFLRALGHELTGELSGTGERVADAWADELLDGYRAIAGAPPRRIDGRGQGEHGGRGARSGRDHDLPAPPLAGARHRDRRLCAEPAPREYYGTLAKVVGRRTASLLQEQVGKQIVQALRHELEPHAALCILTMTHSCLVGRGEQAGAVVGGDGDRRGISLHRQELLTSLRAMSRRP